MCRWQLSNQKIESVESRHSSKTGWLIQGITPGPHTSVVALGFALTSYDFRSYCNG